jgi:hypothetical protein
MTFSISELLLWLFVLNLGIACGAGLYETRLVVPQWFSPARPAGYQVHGEAMHRLNSGLKFWAYVTTGPLTLLTLANLAAASQSTGPQQAWWLGAGLVTLLERVGTFAFFIPTAIRLTHPERLLPRVASRLATRWVRLNHVRTLLTVVGWLLALRALALVG